MKEKWVDRALQDLEQTRRMELGTRIHDAIEQGDVRVLVPATAPEPLEYQRSLRPHFGLLYYLYTDRVSR